ncbi:hypothetical protein [Pseudoalteromonas sp. GB56]
MNAEQFKSQVKQIKVGKKLPDAIYFHKDAFSHAPEPLIKFISLVAKALKIADDEWNLVKLFRNDFRLSLLSYPKFFTESYPALERSITIDLVKLSHRITHYGDHDNPPILHRKETMIPQEHASYQLFSEITQEGEQAGLYKNARMIGFKNSWLRLIDQHGYQLINGRLVHAENDTKAREAQTEEQQIDRHKTALVRHELSAPLKTLAKHGFLNGDYSFSTTAADGETTSASLRRTA